ncbi:hypothetical protein MKW98_015902 [Papaver atlanticum]|uniref:Uncharacterized protein n=1 Tax=Papaver atlanticum TaxID=357466 RepID=A0AAD4STH1_9MAGN|nr:hypothetical protein MKW98_015902 [Papaver atlanticum]
MYETQLKRKGGINFRVQNLSPEVAGKPKGCDSRKGRDGSGSKWLLEDDENERNSSSKTRLWRRRLHLPSITSVIEAIADTSSCGLVMEKVWGSSTAGSGNEDDFDARKDVRSKQPKKYLEKRSGKKRSGGLHDRESEK